MKQHNSAQPARFHADITHRKGEGYRGGHIEKIEKNGGIAAGKNELLRFLIAVLTGRITSKKNIGIGEREGKLELSPDRQDAQGLHNNIYGQTRMMARRITQRDIEEGNASQHPQNQSLKKQRQLDGATS